MKELIGKTVFSIKVDAEEQLFLKFETNEGDLVYYAYGDCCSESWFADITSPHVLVGGKVTNVEEIDMPEVTDERVRQEETVAYGYRITTTKGRMEIAYRNSSNGYYGGSCELITEGGDWYNFERYGEGISEVKWFTVTEDYSK